MTKPLEQPQKIKKPRKPTPAQYKKALIETALDYVEIRPCRECGWPHIKIYCCTYCGSTDP